jgi:hypothetical protein
MRTFAIRQGKAVYEAKEGYEYEEKDEHGGTEKGRSYTEERYLGMGQQAKTERA